MTITKELPLLVKEIEAILDLPLNLHMAKIMQKNFIKLMVVGLVLASFSFAGLLWDSRDGQKYRTVKIGSLIWMAENMNFKTKDSWCYHLKTSNCDIFGRLYKWNSAVSVCPAGWHLPSLREYQMLINAVGGRDAAGKMLKSKYEWNWSGEDAYGFSAFPGGYFYRGKSELAGIDAKFWSLEDDYGSYAYTLGLDGTDYAELKLWGKEYAFSVRCVQENDVSREDLREEYLESSSSQMKDSRDSQMYKIAEIGGQIWMTENLNYEYKDGEQSWCYDNKPANCEKYGRLYTWEVAKKVCPNGWHLPSKEEWDALLIPLGAREKKETGDWYYYKGVGTKLKSSSGWDVKEGYPAGDDAYGFSVLPGGIMHDGGGFDGEGFLAYFWSNTDYESRTGETKYYYMDMGFGENTYISYYGDEYVGYDLNSTAFSVRCLKNYSDADVQHSVYEVEPNHLLNLSLHITDDYLEIGCRGGFLPRVYYKIRNDHTGVHFDFVQKKSEDDSGRIIWALYPSKAAEPGSVYVDPNIGEIITMVGEGPNGLTPPNSLQRISERMSLEVAPLSAFDVVIQDLVKIHRQFIDLYDADKINLLESFDGATRERHLEKLKSYRPLMGLLTSAGYYNIRFAILEDSGFDFDNYTTSEILELMTDMVDALGVTLYKQNYHYPKAPQTRGVLKELTAKTHIATNNASAAGKTVLGGRRGKANGDSNEGHAEGGSGGIATKAMGSIKTPSARDIDVSGGSRSAADIMKVVKPRTPGLRHIYNKHLKKKPGFQGKVTLRFTIAPGGEVISISIASSTTGYGEFENEVKNAVKRWSFGAVQSGNTTVTIPFTFTE